MADKPSRALVLYGHGLASSITPSHYNIHALASRGCCGFLALHNPPQESEDERLVRDLSQLFDASDAEGIEASEAQCKMKTVSERFMGMKAAVVTNSSVVKSFGEKLGLIAIEVDKLNNSESSKGVAASELLKLLGFENGRTSETSQFDLVFVHIGSHDDGAESMNSLVGQILKQTAQPGSEIASRLHLSLVTSYDAASQDDPSISLSAHKGNNSDLSVLFPRQSYTVKGGKPRAEIRHQCPMLIAQWQEGVTRKDLVEMYSFDDFRKHSGNLAIPADRFLHEVAFKLWKAAKYGA